ncbi:MAG: hypothetical protein NTV22_05705 [bacterium]|nr:hypothetical protein [bacterium]
MNLDGIERRIRALLPPPERYAVLGYTHDAGAARVVCGTDPGGSLTQDEAEVLTERGLAEWDARLADMDKSQRGLLRNAWHDNAVLPRCDAPAQNMLRAIGYKP